MKYIRKSFYNNAAQLTYTLNKYIIKNNFSDEDVVEIRIVMIGPVYPYRGGIAQYTGLMSRSLAKYHEIINVSYKLQYPRLLYRNEQKDYSNDTFKIEPVEFWINTLNPFTWISTAKRINRLSPDLVIFQWWHPFFAPAYWSILKFLKKDIRVLFLCHNVLPHEGFPFKRLLSRMVLRQGDAFIVQSKQDKTDLYKLVPHPCVRRTVLPTFNAFRLQGMSQEHARQILQIPVHQELLLFFGFVREYKGLKHLIRALPQIKQERPNVHVLVVGEFFSGGKQEYLDLIRQMNCADSLTLVDHYIPDQEVEPYFAACDLVVLPYESATQSGIVQISYGFEKPVVATAVGGLPEVVIDGKTGFVVPPQDKDSLAKAVIRFFEENKAADFAEGIRQEAWKYSWDRINEVVEELAKKDE